MSTMRLPRILCVDDEPNVLESMKRQLRDEFDVSTAQNGLFGLKAVRDNGPFEVVVSDMLMPQVNGIVFLERMRQFAPQTVRILLTGQADLDAAIAAVNEGNIFRFLTKPCPTDVLQKTLHAATEQHRLIQSERVLLEQTLHGCIKTLTDILSLANPLAFGRAVRAKAHVGELVAYLSLSDGWMIEVAAMLSQIGCITLPASTVEKLCGAGELNEAERGMVDGLPAITDRLLANIPRLEPIRAILIHQHRRFDAGETVSVGTRHETVPVGARVLKVVLDFLALQSEGMSALLALDTLRSRAGCYDPQIIQGFAETLGSSKRCVEVQDLPLANLKPGMVFAQDVKTRAGVLLITKGQEVTASALERLRNFSKLPPEFRPKDRCLVIIRTVMAKEAVTHRTPREPEPPSAAPPQSA